MKWLNGAKISFVLVGLIVASSMAYALGQADDKNSVSGISSAADPRLGKIVVVEVTFPVRDALDELARSGYDISNVQGNVATIYASLEELELLKETGYPLHEIEPRARGFELMALGGYHNYDTLTDELNIYAEAYPEICRLYTLGQSVQGRELWAVLISDNPDDDEDEPEFKYVSTIHGNEPEGTEMCLYFIDLLLTEYGTDERITNIVDSTAIWIVPLMNPDGLALGTRKNANGIDLNRNFPLLTGNSLNIFTGEPLNEASRQPEVQHVMNWMAQNSFVLSADFHAGEVVVLYPYSYTNERTPDDALFQDISRRYSMHNPPMWNNSSFTDGVVNGAGWFIAAGESMDWCYSYLSCNAVTIELVKSQAILPASRIPALWSDNKESMLSFLEAVHIGVRGIVTDRVSGEPLWAQVLVKGNSHPVFNDPNVGDYHRMLLPGVYDLIFHAYGYVPLTVKDITVTDGNTVRVDVELIPEQASPDFNGDFIIDIDDLLILIENWGQEEPSVDIAPLPDGDGIVDEQDLALLMEYWQQEIPEFRDFGEIAHWKLDEIEGIIAHDSVGGKNATLNGNPVWQPTAGVLGGALQLDGINDYVSTPLVLNTTSPGPFSVFAWVKCGAPGQVIFSQKGRSDWLLADPADGSLTTKLRFLTKPDLTLKSETVITDGDWHRVGLVWDDSNRILYVDGVEVASDTYDKGMLMGDLQIGAGKNLEAGSFWSGLIDDVRIYNRAIIP